MVRRYLGKEDQGQLLWRKQDVSKMSPELMVGSSEGQLLNNFGRKTHRQFPDPFP